MGRDNFSIPGYDQWKTRAPEDEPGYWDDKDDPDDEVCPPCRRGDHVGCLELGCACECDCDVQGEEGRLPIPCSKCGKPTTFDPTYGDLCYQCCRADNE